jgi:hypothetical protein
MSKLQYKKYKKEILEMYSEGKSAAEIAEIISAKYSNSSIVKSSGHEAIKTNESGKDLSEIIEFVSQIEKEFYKTFTSFIINNYELDKAVDMLIERDQKNKIKYLLFGGMTLMALMFGMLLGYHDACTGATMPIFSFNYLKNIWPGVLVGLGLLLLVDICIIIRHKRDCN